MIFSNHFLSAEQPIRSLQNQECLLKVEKIYYYESSLNYFGKKFYDEFCIIFSRLVCQNLNSQHALSIIEKIFDPSSLGICSLGILFDEI